MKEETHKLLEQAHHLVIKVTGIDISKSERNEVMKEVGLIYKQIKEVDIDVWKLIDLDDNHKTEQEIEMFEFLTQQEIEMFEFLTVLKLTKWTL